MTTVDPVASTKALDLVGRLPMPALHGIASLGAWVMHSVLRYRREVIEQNIRRSFPSMGDSDVRRTIKKFYLNFCDSFAEFMAIQHLSQAELARRCVPVNPQLLIDLESQHKNVVMMIGHVANWEFTPYVIGKIFGGETLVVYKRQSNQAMEKWLLKVRGKFGGRQVPMEGAGRAALALSRSAGVQLLLAGDQSPTRDASRFWVNFLNQETAFYEGGAKLALAMKAPLVFGHMIRTRRGHYAFEMDVLHVPGDGQNQEDITLKYVSRLEQAIRSAPSDWLWSHRRWKVERPAEVTHVLQPTPTA